MKGDYLIVITIYPDEDSNNADWLKGSSEERKIRQLKYDMK
jgi:hypothetical protein